MENRLVLKLSDNHIKHLENLPEQGMGYQVVDVELFNGVVLRNRIVLNATFLKLMKDKEFSKKDIKKIKTIEKAK